MQTFTRYLMLPAILLATGCSSTVTETTGSSDIEQSDLAGKRFNAAMSAGTAPSTKLPEGSKMQAIFDQDSTGRMRTTKDSQFTDINFIWYVEEDSIVLNFLPVGSNNMKLKVQRDGSGFMLSDKDGSMLLTP